ncbi:MAG: hypothetical protein ACI8ZN_000069 [Bacteroidia bacterium]|jgi:hypothetical protein
MDEINAAILDLLIFPENFANIVSECTLTDNKHVIADVLKQLMHDELVYPLLLNQNGDLVRSLGYDTDFMNDYHYQLSSLGIKTLQRHKHSTGG